MRLLTDENVSVPSIALFREHELDVVAVMETARGLKDPDVIRLARRLGRVLVTFDSDIGEQLFRHGAPLPPGVIYLRFIQSDPEETARVVLQILGLDEPPIEGHFVTVRNGRIRHQPLP